MMRKLVFLIILFLSTAGFVYAQAWQTDFEEAKKIAQQSELPIILVFQGSDWCAPCIKLEKEIWSTEEFQNYAQSHFVMLKADFPRKKANKLNADQQDKNAKLAEKYNQKGYFPLVVVLDKQGKVLGETGYENKSPEEYIKLLTSFIP
jgi:thioredoxin-related protein